MPEVLNTRLVVAWAALVVVTGLVFLVAGFHTATACSVAVAIGFIKARVVAFEFMEVRHAPAWLRWAVDGWCLATAVALIAIELVPHLLQGHS